MRIGARTIAARRPFTVRTSACDALGAGGTTPLAGGYRVELARFGA